MVKTKLFVALDCKNEKEAQSIVDQIAPINKRFKVGLELFLAAGKDFLKKLIDREIEIFLDLKFHDIPNTVYGAIKQVATLGISHTTVHIAGGEAMVKAAKKAIQECSKNSSYPPTKLLGVSVLTSLDEESIAPLGITKTVKEQVSEMTKLGKLWGIDGIVCSPLELQAVKKIAERDICIVVPGIRLSHTEEADDQKRILTPKEASRLGADYIVVGRPILKAKDPVRTTESILEQLC